MMSNQPSEHPFFGEVISVYTRAQTLADGVLIDAGPMAGEAGFHWPVAITAGAWADCVTWSDADSERQTLGSLVRGTVPGRLRCPDQREGSSELLFELYRVPRNGQATEAELTMLKLVVGPVDHGEPVVAILPNED